MTEKITDTFFVQDRRPIWLGGFKEKFDALLHKTENAGKSFDIKIEYVKQDAQYWQHKYYRGYLLPAIAAESFDGIDAKAHYALKKMILIRHVTSWEEIPDKHRGRGIPLLREVLKDGEVTDELYAYIPSTGDLTRKEFEEYIKKVESITAELQLSFVDKDGNNVEREAYDARKRGFGG